MRPNRAHALRKSLKTPLELLAIGYWYEDFEQVSDEAVAELIERSPDAKGRETNTVTPSTATGARLWKEKRNTGARSGQ